MKLFAALALLALAGCGADGAPQAPVQTGMVITGSASAGIARDGG